MNYDLNKTTQNILYGIFSAGTINPSVTDYGRTKTSRGNTTRVKLGNLILWYSYRTVIAYRDETDGMVVSENLWGTTTGKHIGWALMDNDGGYIERTKRSKFEEMLESAMGRLSQDNQ